jgi:RND superfamily putative drug exporter
MVFTRVGEFLVRRRRWVVAFAALFMVAAAVYGGDVAGRLSNGGFSDPTAESTKADQYLTDTLHSGSPNLVLVVTPARAGASIDDPAIAGAANDLTTELAAHPGISQVTSYWALGSPAPLRSTSGDSALVLGHLDGSEDQVRVTVKDISEHFNQRGDVTVVQVGGLAEAFHQVGDTIEHDLQLAEMIALPITLLVLVLVFRSVVSATLPLLAGGFAIVGTFMVLKLLSDITTVSIFSLNLTTALGLGLAIDYSLFVVSRYREERGRGLEPHDAVVRTVATAGRSVVFSGLTVAVSLAALLVFPIAFLKSFAYAGIPVVAMAVIGSVVALPAVVAMLGDRIEWLPVRRRKAVAADADIERSFWFRVASAVMGRPIIVATTVTIVLLALATPFLHMNVGLPDDRVLPTSASSRQVGDELRAEYSSKETGALSVVMPGASLSTDNIERYAKDLSTLSGAARVDAPTGIYINGAKVLGQGPLSARFISSGGEWLSVVPSVEPVSAAGEQLVRDVRATEAPARTAVYVGGQAAALVDTKDAILARLPWAIAIIAAATFVLLFLSFGSLLVPAKALVLNTLSLTATFGAMVWIFQDGHLAGTLNFTPTGVLDLTTPILMFCIAFGLSMDYEVFLLSRIKEEHDRTGDNTRAVAVGLARTGRIITAAAATIAVVFLAFATSSITFIKLFGLGLALAVIVDATVIRATLVPAFMRLAGEANWWAPRWMRRIYERIGMSESEPNDAVVDAEADVRDETPVPITTEADEPPTDDSSTNSEPVMVP